MSPTPTISAATKHSKAARMMGQVEPRRSTRAPIVRPMNMSEYAKAPVSIFSPLYAPTPEENAATTRAADAARGAPPAPAKRPAPPAAKERPEGTRRSTRVPIPLGSLDMAEYAKPTTQSIYAAGYAAAAPAAPAAAEPRVSTSPPAKRPRPAPKGPSRSDMERAAASGLLSVFAAVEASGDESATAGSASSSPPGPRRRAPSPDAAAAAAPPEPAPEQSPKDVVDALGLALERAPVDALAPDELQALQSKLFALSYRITGVLAQRASTA